MIIKESRIIMDDDKGYHCPTGQYVDGYYLTLKDLERLVRDFQADSHDRFMSNDESYQDMTLMQVIEIWLKKHERIVKKD
jgi:hypothetical protein